MYCPQTIQNLKNHLGQMYPAELEIKDTIESTTSASYLDLLLSIGRDGDTFIYDKWDDFIFHIANFQFLSRYIPSWPAYGVFISHFTRYARVCSSYKCFILRARRLSSKLLKQGYLVDRLKMLFREFNGRYGDLIQQYEVSLSRMLDDILTLGQQWLPNRSDFSPISRPWYRAWLSANYEGFPWSILQLHFGTCICSNVENNLSWACLVSGLLNCEHPSVLLFCLQAVWHESRERLPLRTHGSVALLEFVCAPIVETRCLELTGSLLYTLNTLGTFSTLSEYMQLYI